MLVGREECEGHVFDSSGERCCVVLPDPKVTYRQMLLFCRCEHLTPEESLLDIDPGMPPERKREALRAQDWFAKKLKSVS